MDKSILLQKQVRDNSQDLRSYLQGLGKWEEEIKRKEDELNKKDVVAEVPLPRNKSAKTKENKPTNIAKGKSKAKLNSYDYSAWDKFDVEKELEKIDSAQEQPEKEDSESDNEDVSEEYKARLREESIYEKERGNQFVKNKKWDEAITCYTHAIACCSKDPVFYANRALCFLKKDEFSSAEADCTSSLQLDPTYVKALQRRAAARIGRKQLIEALGDLSRVLELEPHNNESKTELQKLEKQLGVTVPKAAAKVVPKAPEIIAPKQATPPPNKIEAPNSKTELNKERLIPWPERQTQSVLAIRKLPHQRSKKPIKRIEILQSDSNTINLNIDLIELQTKCAKVALDPQNANTFTKIDTNAQKLPEEVENSGGAQIENRDAKPQKSENKGFKIEPNPELFEANGIQSMDPETMKLWHTANNIPKTSVQFYANWKTLGLDYNLKYLSLKKIDPAELPNIFRDSMESDVFSEIIQILYTFMKLISNVALFVENLTKLKRFSALSMFMSQNDKEALEKIFQYCEAEGKMPKDNIEKLRIKYEI